MLFNTRHFRETKEASVYVTGKSEEILPITQATTWLKALEITRVEH